MGSYYRKGTGPYILFCNCQCHLVPKAYIDLVTLPLDWSQHVLGV